MNETALLIAIRTRLRQRKLPDQPPWRVSGEYASGGLCDGCGGRFTSAQASYFVDFSAGSTPESARFHRVCFDAWQRERELARTTAGDVKA
ncbi:MAG TPA: hypothetical protein VJ011_00985 [Steroidobacteraceae bacterium]|nr:hypothetical protein [Steroidobacteraceae bacterium]